MIVGHVRVGIPKRAERILHRIGKTWNAAHVRAFSDAFCTDGMVRRWGDCEVRFIVRHFPRGRQEEVHQGPRFDVTHVVVGDLLPQGDGERFGQTTVHLTFDDHRINPRTTVIQRIEAANFRNTCIYINVHDADIRPEWIGHIGRVVIADRFQTWLQPWNSLIVGRKGDFLHRLELFRSTFDGKTIYVEFHIVVVNL